MLPFLRIIIISRIKYRTAALRTASHDMTDSNHQGNGIPFQKASVFLGDLTITPVPSERGILRVAS
jgi:hypothetical protein